MNKSEADMPAKFVDIDDVMSVRLSVCLYV